MLRCVLLETALNAGSACIGRRGPRGGVLSPTGGTSGLLKYCNWQHTFLHIAKHLRIISYRIAIFCMISYRIYRFSLWLYRAITNVNNTTLGRWASTLCCRMFIAHSIMFHTSAKSCVCHFCAGVAILCSLEHYVALWPCSLTLTCSP